ncbi:MAG TPA: hypothetical protein VI612_01965 [Candidatus Nanoarchaeia archaeon]|nr:hypothetical protein [Candidatus Nanoarchaeia archaeon]
MAKLDGNKLGLTFGIFGAILHAVWSLFVAIMPSGLQGFLNWLMLLHSLSMPAVVMPFSLMNAILLVIAVFVIWYALGRVFAAVWNWVAKF